MTLFVSGKLLWTEEEACLLGLHWFTFYTKINTVCQMGIWHMLYPKIGMKMINLFLSLFKVYPNKRIKSQTYE